jgi:hypothetical protein
MIGIIPAPLLLFKSSLNDRPEKNTQREITGYSFL